jgi:hypothetical protein
LQGAIESARQRVGGRLPRGVSGSDAEVEDALSPVELVVVLRDNYLRRAGSRSGSGRAGATVVNDSNTAGGTAPLQLNQGCRSSHVWELRPPVALGRPNSFDRQLGPEPLSSLS